MRESFFVVLPWHYRWRTFKQQQPSDLSQSLIWGVMSILQRMDTASLAYVPQFFVSSDEKHRELVGGNASLYPEEEEPYFMVPKHIAPFETFPFVRRQDELQMCPFGRLMGLPPALSSNILHYAQETGLVDLFWSHLYGSTSPLRKQDGVVNTSINCFDPSRNDACVFVDENRGYEQIDTLPGGQQWSTMTPVGPTSNWPFCDIHWMDAANERGHEETLRVLRDSGFDQVLDTVGQEFGLDSLAVTGFGLMAISHCNQSIPHRDNDGAQEFFFQLIIPILLPEFDKATLNLGGFDSEGQQVVGPLQFRHDMGILISGDTFHSTPDFDFRPNHGIRMVASIYFADLVYQGLPELVAGDGTSIFPGGMVEWVETQVGRHWSRYEDSSLVNDQGRYPLDNIVQDLWEDCEQLAQQGQCEKDIRGARMACVKSCGIFMDDEAYFGELFPDSEKRFLVDTTEAHTETYD